MLASTCQQEQALRSLIAEGIVLQFQFWQQNQYKPCGIPIIAESIFTKNKKNVTA
jgi:hypothetical protein